MFFFLNYIIEVNTAFDIEKVSTLENKYMVYEYQKLYRRFVNWDCL